MLTTVRTVVNALNLSTPAGLAIALAGRSTISPGPDGLILAEKYRFSFPVAGAFTVGNVVITHHTFAELARRHPHMLDHEARHASQWALCGSIFFLPLYLLAMAWSWLRTGDRASHNIFEVRAGLASGGYRRKEPRSLLAAVRAGARGANR